VALAGGRLCSFSGRRRTIQPLRSACRRIYSPTGEQEREKEKEGKRETRESGSAAIREGARNEFRAAISRKMIPRHRTGLRKGSRAA